MLRIVDGAGLPTSFYCNLSENYEPGLIAGLKRVDGKVTVGLSDGISVLGIIDDYHNTITGESSVKSSGMISVWNCKNMIAESNFFAHPGFEMGSPKQAFEVISKIYCRGTNLFVDSLGRLTFERQLDLLHPVATALGVVGKTDDVTSFMLTFKWFRNKK